MKYKYYYRNEGLDPTQSVCYTDKGLGNICKPRACDRAWLHIRK